MTDPRFEKLAKLLINYSVELKKGDHIITTGGIHGTIEGIKDNDILLVKTATDTKLHVGRTAVTTVKTK